MGIRNLNFQPFKKVMLFPHKKILSKSQISAVIFFSLQILFPIVGMAQNDSPLPSSKYAIEYDVSAKSNTYIWLIDKTAGKKGNKIKVNLPEAYEIYSTPYFITDYVVQIEVNANNSFNVAGPYLYYYLYVPTADGGFFLKDERENRYIFRNANAKGKNCLIVASSLVFTATGEKLGTFHKTFKNYVSVISKGNEGEETQFYNINTCSKNNTKASGSGFGKTFFELGNSLFILKGDSLLIYNLNSDYLSGKYLTVPSVFLSNLALNKGYWSHFHDPIKKTKLFPVKTGEGLWSYLNENGEKVVAEFNADMALPFLFPKEQAPVLWQGKWGLMNKSGMMTQPFHFDYLNIGEFYPQTIFTKKDSSFTMNSEGRLVPYFNQVKENNYETVCLAYYFKGQKFAYLLVTLNYNKNNVDHQKMSEWVLRNIQPEINGFGERDYYRVNDTWNNVYQADELILKGCSSCKKDFEQLSPYVTILEKTFE